jgi:two-component system cell cycle sensor histidine kinase/response regulator CckA
MHDELVRDLQHPRSDQGDPSERDALEARLRQAERLESLGVMAGGIAHDFNSLLTAILCNADLALASLPQDAPARLAIQRIEVTARRAAALTRQILEATGRARRDRQPVDLSRLVEDTLPMIEPLLPPTSRVELHLEPDLPTIDGDASQLGQVVMNLLSNASEALGGADGMVEVGTGVALHPATLVPSVWLEVTDTGRGMDPETQARIFEPFFSTKEKGRGLGLAAVQGIVRSHGGTLEVRSEAGLGASFRVWFPRDPIPTGADA